MDLTSEISRLELAAAIILAPPNQVSAQERKDAEMLFMQLREGAISLEHCKLIMESTKNHFLMFELARSLVARLLKEWSKFSLDDVKKICDYLFNFPFAYYSPDLSLPNFVSSEMFHSAAMIMKRGSLQSDILFSDLLSKLHTVLNSDNQMFQTYGLQIIEIVANEFSTTWRSSNISITWDFHLKSKKQFEDVLLKQLMKLSLSTLSNIMNNTNDILSSPLQKQICEKFLRVASLILCWNFSPKCLYLHFKILISALRTNSFRPPESWSDIFRDASVVTFFMQLHGLVRYDEQLCHNSLICLTQLASLMGDSLGPGSIALVLPHVSERSERRLATSMSGSELDKCISEDNKVLTHDLYVQTFTLDLIKLFSSVVLDHEMPSLSLIIYKLFTCHPVAIFERFPVDLMRNFVQFVVINIIKLVEPAMQIAMKNDQTYHEPLSNFFQVWRSMLRSTYAFKQEIADYINNQNPRIIECFLKSVLSSPFGNRSKPSSNEIFDENEEEEDDRQVFMDLLCDVGFFALYSIDYFNECISRALVQRLHELRSLDIISCTHEHLQIWQEDFHWLLLIIGYFIRQPSYCNIGNYPEELAMRCLNGYKSGEFVKLTNFEPLFSSCLTDPPFDPDTYPGKLDPITLISTQILSWFSMEHQMLTKLDPNATLLSPTLCQTSLWQFSLLMIVLTPSVSFINVSASQNDEDTTDLDEKDNWDNPFKEELKYLPRISTKSILSAQIIQLALEKLFAILTKMAGEKKLCSAVIDMMINFAEYRAEELATNEHLYTLLSGLNIENLPSRRAFIKSLVLIGSTVESDEIRQKMHLTILDPLLIRFLALAEDLSHIAYSHLADCFECFAGVADAGQSDTANTLFRYLHPVFERCIPLITHCSDSQLLLISILEFIKSSTDILFFYVESQEDTIAYHHLLIGIINAYKETQMHRFHSDVFILRDDVEEQQTQDLSTLIEILCLFQSKTYMPIVGNEGTALNSAKISLHGLEMLLPMMTEELLKVPQLCASFFRLLLFISDIAPEAIAQVSPQMLSDFLRCINTALDNLFGIDRVRSALEIITNLASHCAAEPTEAVKSEPSGNHQLLVEQLLALVPKIFELVMAYSCEVEIFNEANSALFALINLDQESFNGFVNQLLMLPSNQDAKDQLAAAFHRLLQSCPSFTGGPVSKKRQFQSRFQEFLVEVSGCLCLR